MEYEGINELEIFKDGDVLILKPIRPSWITLTDHPKADEDWLKDRNLLIAPND